MLALYYRLWRHRLAGSVKKLRVISTNESRRLCKSFEHRKSLFRKINNCHRDFKLNSVSRKNRQTTEGRTTKHESSHNLLQLAQRKQKGKKSDKHKRANFINYVTWVGRFINYVDLSWFKVAVERRDHKYCLDAANFRGQKSLGEVHGERWKVPSLNEACSRLSEFTETDATSESPSHTNKKHVSQSHNSFFIATDSLLLFFSTPDAKGKSLLGQTKVRQFVAVYRSPGLRQKADCWRSEGNETHKAKSLK